LRGANIVATEDIMRGAIVQFMRDLRDAVRRWFADDGSLMSSATAYYVGLSFFPLLLVLIAGMGWFLQYTNQGQDAQQKVLEAISQNMSPVFADYVQKSLDTLKDKSRISGPVGLATILITSLAAFAQLDAAFDRIWKLAPQGSSSIFLVAWRFLLQRGRAFLLLLALGLFVVLLFLVGMVLTAVKSNTDTIFPHNGWLWDAVPIGVSLITNMVAFTLLFRLLPKAPVSWDEAFHGGLLTAVAWEIGRQLLAVFIARGKYTSAYGVIGAFLAVLLWCYYAVTIVLLGAEYIQVIRARRRAEKAARK
jgi:membrane protein